MNQENEPGTLGIAGMDTGAGASAGRRVKPAGARVSAGAGALTPPAVCSEAGMLTEAVVPPPWVGTSSTVSPCRRASRPTTNRPSTVVGMMSSRSRSTSRRFSSASFCGVIPIPWSTTLIWQRPSPPIRACTSTVDSGGENAVAFSSSSANSSTRSATSGEATVRSGTAPKLTR